MPTSPNYNEKSATGTSWVRCCSINIENPLNGTPSASLQEEQVTDFGDDNVFHKSLGSLGLTFDPTNPDDGMLYYLLNKKYVTLREERDARVEEEAKKAAEQAAQAPQ